MEGDSKVAVVFDLDHTLTKRDTYLAFLFLGLRKRPIRLFFSVGLPIAVLTYWLKLRNNTWLKERFLSAILEGSTKEQLDQWADEFLCKLLRSGLRTRAREIIESHRATGHKLILVTASFDFYVEKLANHLGFNAVISTESAWSPDGKLKGKLKSDNCYGTVKVERLNAYFADNRNDWCIVAYSDSHRDLPMLEWADYSVAVNPTQKLRAIALDRKYEIQDWDSSTR